MATAALLLVSCGSESGSGGISSESSKTQNSSADKGTSSGSSSGSSSTSSGSSSTSSSGGADAGSSTGQGTSPGASGSSSGTSSSGGNGTQPPGETGKGSAGNDSGGSSGGSEGKKDGNKPKDPATGTGNPTDKDKNKVCNKKDKVVLYLSADDSNSMAGAQIARGLIKQGQHVYKGLRTYEFLNYYTFNYTPAKADHVAVTAQMRKDGDGKYSLQIGVRAPQIAEKDRRKVHIVIAVDTSSSMGWGPMGDTGIDRAIATCQAIAGSLGKGDKVSVVTWGGSVAVKLAALALKSANDPQFIQACQALGASGVTNLGGGLSEAYKLAAKHFDKQKINRVVLISDGGTNVGEKDKEVIAKAAKDANGESIYLLGVGVGDPWNYNDSLMDAVTDAGKGAYVFLDEIGEASKVFSDGLLRHLEVAARDVQVELTLPPTFAMAAFHGEQFSTDKSKVEPQHLAANDAMIFHQVVSSCDPAAIDAKAMLKVTATYKHPITNKVQTDTFEASLADLLKGDHSLLLKGDAVVEYAETLKELRSLSGDKAIKRIDAAIKVIENGLSKLNNDTELVGLKDLLLAHKTVFKKGQVDMYPTGGTGAKGIGKACSCNGVGSSLEAMSCAVGLCDSKVLLGQTYTSLTGSTTKGTFAAVKRFGSSSNHLAPREGGSYALMATGPALGTQHSKNVGGTSGVDPIAGGSMFNAMRWTLKLKAPEGANGFRLKHVFFSQEYDEYVGSQFNDKFYMIIRAGSTNGGKETVINYTKCREPNKHHDFVCSPGMQYCNPRQRYCYIAINTAASECCWLGGCPNGKAKTDISGTGFSCAASQSSDSSSKGSSTGWMTTEWPIEPGEEFELTFHVHDTGDGVYDSEIIVDAFEFVGSVTPGTWTPTM